VKRHGIAYHEKTLGQLFCDGSAQQIVTMLERECSAAGVEMRSGVRVLAVEQRSSAGDRGRFRVQTSLAEIVCEAVIVGTGGLSIPKMGATGFGYEMARQFGHAVVEPRPALVPLLLSAQEREQWCDLTGVSAEVVARAEESKPNRKQRALQSRAPQFREKLLITHRGLSGPAVLQVSSYWRPGETVRFDLAPGREVFASLRAQNARRDVSSAQAVLREVLPGRMAERWVAVMTRDPDWTNAGLDRLERAVHEWTVRPDGTEGFAKAEVTAGGVDTRELDARTMESRRVPGLYFIGEVVDVTGWLGGYNFQWAWASGASAGRAA
jgi:predicted Rossmann fold flavoprotein